uniref:Neurotransmitter-gated ion-channel ligand-binding domain-containing protein n=1 Tax=Ditylenchus dipsaci TaxID=166011 RepID=A0A915DFW7_9BILA
MLLLLQYFPISDSLPLPRRAEKKVNHRFKVDFFHDSNGKWFSMLNLRVTLQSPDILDVEDNSSSGSIKDFDQLDEEDVEDDENLTNIIIKPASAVGPDETLIATPSATTRQPDFQAEQTPAMATNSFNERTSSAGPIVASSTDIVYLDNDQIPGLDDVRQLVTLHIPHKLRHNGHKHTSTSTSHTTTQSTTTPAETGDEHARDVLNINVDDEDYSYAQNSTFLPTTVNTDAQTSEESNGTTSQVMELGLETILMSSSANETEADGMNATELMDPKMIGNMSMFGNSTMFSLEPENITLSPEQEYQLMAKEILHSDALNRDPEVMRILLSNLSYLEDSEAREYDNNSAPMMFTDVPINVKVSLNIIHLTNFDSQQMEYTIDLELNMAWFDVRLANNYTKPIRVRESYILDQIWKPDPYFNSKFSYFHTVSFPNFRMRIMPDGFVLYTLRVTLLPDCQMTFCRHPHDSQKCFLVLSSVAYTKSVIQFHWHSTKPVLFSTKVSLPELRIKRLATDTCAVEGKLISSSCLRLAFFMERDGARYIVEKYIPSTLAMMFAWVAPYVPYNYEDVRIITPITVLLTLVQMEKGDLEVRTSYLTSMDIWFVAMKTFSVISLVESLIVLALIKRGRAMERQAQRAVNEYKRHYYESEKLRITELYHRLDTTSRFLSPMVFVVFFVYYVLYVAQGDERSCLPKAQY